MKIRRGGRVGMMKTRSGVRGEGRIKTRRGGRGE